MISLVLAALIIFLLVTGFRGAASRGARQGAGTAIRRFFQYLLLFGLLVVVAVGLSGLLARALDRSAIVLADQADLARNLSFVIVGIPLLLIVAQWTRRRIAAEARELMSTGWTLYISLAELTAIVITTLALQDVILWIVRARSFDGGALSRAVVWGVVWAMHWQLDERTASGRLRDHHLAGAAFGLWVAAAGLASTVGSLGQSLLGLSGSQLIDAQDHPVTRAAVSLVTGAAVWALYWLGSVQRGERGSHWHAYVMIAGVGGGLVASVIAATIALYDSLVWVMGTPETAEASVHFRGVAQAVGVLVAGLLVWWYHRQVLAREHMVGREEPRRVYEYVVAAIGLGAAAVGVTILVVAFLESVTAAEQLAGPGAGNTLILAATLLLVGLPVWWLFWRRIRIEVREHPDLECASPTRRIYLFILFGVVGIASVIALLVTVYLLFDDIVSGRIGATTLRRMRWGLGVLVTTGTVAAYHWTVYRREREIVPQRAHRTIVVVGPQAADLTKELSRRTGSRIEPWTVPGDYAAADWNAVSIAHAVAAHETGDVVVIAEASGPRVIPAHRS